MPTKSSSVHDMSDGLGLAPHGTSVLSGNVPSVLSPLVTAQVGCYTWSGGNLLGKISSLPSSKGRSSHSHSRNCLQSNSRGRMVKATAHLRAPACSQHAVCHHPVMMNDLNLLHTTRAHPLHPRSSHHRVWVTARPTHLGVLSLVVGIHLPIVTHIKLVDHKPPKLPWWSLAMMITTG